MLAKMIQKLVNMGVSSVYSNIFYNNTDISIITLHLLIGKEKGENIGIITVCDTEKSQKQK